MLAPITSVFATFGSTSTKYVPSRDMSGDAEPDVVLLELRREAWLAVRVGAIERGPVDWSSESTLQALDATTMPPTMTAVAMRNFLEMCI